jgi:hypothetical protein
MINKIIAYNIAELENKKVLIEAKNLYKSKVISQEQWQNINKIYASKLYSPSKFIRVLFFILTLIGLSTVSAPMSLIVIDINSQSAIQIMLFITGVSIMVITDLVLIKKNNHYLSGVTEAGIYTGLSFIASGLLAGDHINVLVYPLVGLLFSAFAAIRYLNLLALTATFFFLGWFIFQLVFTIGGTIEALLPFIFMFVFGGAYFGIKKLKPKLTNIVFDNHFILGQTLALLIFYIAGNYFVVRELSIELMRLNLAEGEDIPFAYLFYGFTVLVPLAYIYFGVKHKSILLIRTGLLTIALSVITLKYYFSLGMPMLTITLSGAILITIAFLMFNYLKQMRNGFTTAKLLNDQWSSQNLTAIVASQTLGGNNLPETPNEDIFNGGEFGGGGAGSNW